MVKTQKMMKITTQKVISAHIMHQDALESKNKRFWKFKMAAILPKYGQNPENDDDGKAHPYEHICQWKHACIFDGFRALARENLKF